MEEESIAQAVVQEAASSGNGQLSCAAALALARRLRARPRQVGEAATRQGIRIVDCQLGCFIVSKATHDDLDTLPVGNRLAREIGASLVAGHLPCAAAFSVARRTGVTPKEVGDAATKQKIKISRCQLGCFP
jgi:hypothetical protein